jgi:hypothetical protein
VKASNNMTTPNYEPLDVQDFLDATGDAAKRSRTITIILLVASVLIFAGLINSLGHSWMDGRLTSFSELKSPYVTSKIGPPPVDGDSECTLEYAWGVRTYEQALTVYRNRHEAFYRALCSAYVDTGLLVRVPFFGFALDVNDLGLVGGLALLVLLSVYQFALSRELDNLSISFREAESREFYLLLAMRQVFTVPQSGFVPKTAFLRHAPKAVLAFPLITYASVVGHDWWTNVIAFQLGETHAIIALAFETVALVGIVLLSRLALHRLAQMDDLWDRAWDSLERNQQ